MPVMIHCTSCGAPFHVEESTLGKLVICMRCQAAFQAVAERPLTGPVPTALPRPHRTNTSPNEGVAPSWLVGEWTTTMSGIRLLQICSVSMLVVMMLAGLVQLLAPATSEMRFEWGAMSGLQGVRVVTTFAAFAFLVAAFTGVCMCLNAPDSIARRHAITGFLLCIGFFLVIFAAAAMHQVLAGDRAIRPIGDVTVMNVFRSGPFGVSLVIVLFGLPTAAFVFWMLFHAAIANHFQDFTLHSFSVTALVAILFVQVLAVAIDFALTAVITDRHAVLQLKGLSSIVTALVQFGLYYLVCTKSIAAIRSGMANSDGGGRG